MSFTLLIKYWQLILCIGIASIFGSLLIKEKAITQYYKSQLEKEQKDYRQYVDSQTQAYLKIEQVNKELENKYKSIVQDQEKQNNEAIKQIEVTRNKSNNTISSLRKTISTYQSQLSSYPLTTQIKYSYTYSQLFTECATRLAEVAEQGDRESVDKMTLYNSWMNMKNESDKQLNNKEIK